MYHIITCQEDINYLMERFSHFHDSCLFKIEYISGAYVTENLEMNPINNERTLKIIFQSQESSVYSIELEFKGLLSLCLIPTEPLCTCELYDVALLIEKNKVYWADSVEFFDKKTAYKGTWLCAESLRWRVL